MPAAPPRCRQPVRRVGQGGPPHRAETDIAFEFKLTWKLPDGLTDEDELMQRLGDAGCTDALVGLGLGLGVGVGVGVAGLEFIRKAKSAQAAILSAVDDVKRALPGARLIEAGPDFVGLTDVAELVGLSRQNIHKLWLNNDAAFPPPVHAGAASVWHLAQVLQFLKERQYSFARPVFEVACVTMKLNIARQVSMVSSADLARMQRRVGVLSQA